MCLQASVCKAERKVSFFSSLSPSRHAFARPETREIRSHTHTEKSVHVSGSILSLSPLTQQQHQHDHSLSRQSQLTRSAFQLKTWCRPPLPPSPATHLLHSNSTCSSSSSNSRRHTSSSISAADVPASVAMPAHDHVLCMLLSLKCCCSSLFSPSPPFLSVVQTSIWRRHQSSVDAAHAALFSFYRPSLSSCSLLHVTSHAPHVHTPCSAVATRSDAVRPSIRRPHPLTLSA